jgi:hypothetical protein
MPIPGHVGARARALSAVLRGRGPEIRAFAKEPGRALTGREPPGRQRASCVAHEVGVSDATVTARHERLRATNVLDRADRKQLLDLMARLRALDGAASTGILVYLELSKQPYDRGAHACVQRPTAEQAVAPSLEQEVVTT